MRTTKRDIIREYCLNSFSQDSEGKEAEIYDTSFVLLSGPVVTIDFLELVYNAKGEIHATFGKATYIFTKAVVSREDFVVESAMKLCRFFNLEDSKIKDVENTLNHFLGYIEENA